MHSHARMTYTTGSADTVNKEDSSACKRAPAASPQVDKMKQNLYPHDCRNCRSQSSL